MTAKLQQNFEIWSNNHANVIFTITNGSSASVQLSGASWMLAEGETSGSLVKLVAGGSGITISGCTATVSLSPAHTINLQGYYYHELKGEDSASNVSTVAVGTVNIKGNLL